MQCAAGPKDADHRRVKSFIDIFRVGEKQIWFDDEQLTGHIEGQVTEGIDRSDVFVAFITKDYILKRCLKGLNFIERIAQQ